MDASGEKREEKTKFRKVIFMKKSDTGFKILSVTLIALLIAGLLHRFAYSAFSMAKAGQVFWYDWGLWKQYYGWLPGKIPAGSVPPFLPGRGKRRPAPMPPEIP